jgi:hypothetical protein
LLLPVALSRFRSQYSMPGYCLNSRVRILQSAGALPP